MNEVSSSSFEFYEGLRVLVPGSLAVGLFAAATRTFGVGDAITFEDAVIAVVATLAIGFVLLFVDVPARAAVFCVRGPGAVLALMGRSAAGASRGESSERLLRDTRH